MTDGAKPMTPDQIEVALFDMDGVVTDTAEAHAAAWKRLFDQYLEARSERAGERFEPFDAERDYRKHVDGKPRHDGVRDFLASRGIELPEGSPDDDPDRETVCGLGNRKNRYFRAWLEENRVGTFPGTLAFIRRLKDAGVRIAVFSSSRNAEAVLQNAGVLDLFEARVDGNDLAKRRLPGKPDPAMLIEAASRLGAAPERSLVVEDAISGVEAGAAGGFRLVVGVDRTGDGAALRAHGADLVVGDLAELALDPEQGIRAKTLERLPRLPLREEGLRALLPGRDCVVFLDYDGTLTPIIEDHTKAFMDDDMRAAVDRLAQRCTVGIVSGRGLGNLRELVRLDSVLYAGSHGFEIEMPGEMKETLEKGKEFLPDLDEAEATLRERLADIEGAAVERKRFSIAVHYRRVAEGEVAEVEKAVDEVLGDHPRLRKSHGKKVFQLQPRVDWHKGRAIDWMLERLGLGGEEVLPVYVGDDLTDEDAFRALAGRGLSIAVGDEPRRTAADYRLGSPEEVRRFLDLLARLTGEAS